MRRLSGERAEPSIQMHPTHADLRGGISGRKLLLARVILNNFLELLQEITVDRGKVRT